MKIFNLLKSNKHNMWKAVWCIVFKWHVFIKIKFFFNLYLAAKLLIFYSAIILLHFYKAAT